MSRRTRSKAIANTAPPVAGTAPLVTSAEALRWARAQKYNPLPYLEPQMLVRVLDAFEHGNLREACLLWEKIAERDDVIASVKPKREKDVSQLACQVVPLSDDPAAAAHQERLDDFWKNVRCYNSYDRNERGGLRRMVKQMMTAVSYRYAAHHIIWQPRPDGSLRATFEFVPLWQFENRTGRLRYLPNLTSMTGEILADGEWMVTVGDGLMIPCCIGYLAKRSSFNDWLIFSEKFSVPGILGRTTGKKGSPEGEAMRTAVESFGHDWTGVVYGDDGTHAEPIKLVQAAGNPTGMPMPAVIERVDRKFAALYRGADLSSMSSGAGEGTGASLQEGETDILRRDDAEMIAETMEEVSRMVIEWYFGHGTEPLARMELIVPVAEDAAAVIQSGISLAAAGASVSMTALMERAGLPAAKDDADRLRPAAPQSPTGPTGPTSQTIANSADPAPTPPAWLAAFSEDMKPLGKALESAMTAGDDSAMRAALKKISTRMPDFMATEGMEAALQQQFTAALADET
jgi:phage gp29-like protein